MTGDGRLYGDLVARLDVFYFFTDGFNGCRAFVPDKIGIRNDVRADSARSVIMHVAAAYADDLDFQQNIGIVFDNGLWHIGDFHLPDAGQDRRLHKISPIGNLRSLCFSWTIGTINSWNNYDAKHYQTDYE
jgi:hypothetical protein